ncbi:LysR family transcriptional regulator [Streptomyces sp. GESEQ-35]|uniref:LysR family transcriptional regulator n=1 Tax=Streptomyces sp. GESEQ-35 TaxID=2812657 RepID=UPI001B31F88B|nr:LysR family transcriptional regulator [Streptomyces sp. GESEQ-35]
MSEGKPELVALRSFLAVYRWGGVGKAAEALHLSQPAVSYHLKTIERAAGRPLFARSGRGIAPTEAGHSLAANVGEHMDALEQAVADLRPTRTGHGGTVFLGAPADLFSAVFVPRIIGLLDEGILLRCRAGLSDQLVEAVLGDEIDIAVLTKIEGIPTAKLHLVHWKDEDLVLIDRAGAPPYDPRDTSRRFVGYSESMPMARRYFRNCWGLAPPTPALTMPDMRAVVSAVQAGAGLTVIPRLGVESALTEETLAIVHTAPRPVLNSLYLAMRRGRENVPRLRTVFAQLLS